MILASDFVDTAYNANYKFYAGVPCSFLTPFINYVIANKNTTYVSAANEGDAVAMAAGASLGGVRSIAMMQNSGLGNAISPLTSLTHTFNLPILLVCTLRGEPGLNDEPQHELMGEITCDLLEKIKIPWEIFPTNKKDIPSVLDRAESYFKNNSRPYALVMKKGSCQNNKTNLSMPITGQNKPTKIKGHQPSKRPTRSDLLKEITEKSRRANAVILASTGYAGRELYKIKDDNNHFYMVGSMGCISSLGLGLALVQPDLKVILIDGDGAALMRLGNLTTIGAYSPSNIIHFLLDNEIHESTGGQHTVSRSIDFAQIAAACGYQNVTRLSDVEFLDEAVFEDKQKGPTFYHCKTRGEKDSSLPRPTISPKDVAKRLKEYIA